MAGQRPLLPDINGQSRIHTGATRVGSLDVFRGVSVFMMMVVDYGGALLPAMAHSHWNGLHLADFVMPFFLFAAGISVALAYKRVPKRGEATWKAVLRTIKLFLVGIFLQGGYFHGITSLTYGVDIERVRWLGILQRISIGYMTAVLCEIWLPCRRPKEFGFFRSYLGQWCLAMILSAIYSGLLYGLYVPDWHFKLNDNYVYTVKCSVRGDLGPACNAAGMTDRYVIGIKHLYPKPVYRNLKECKMSTNFQGSESSLSWCLAPFDPEGILSSLTAAASCIIGLQFGHVLAHFEDHKRRLRKWCLMSIVLLIFGLLLALSGVPINKPLYTVNYMLITTATAGTTFCGLYLLVDVKDYRRFTLFFEWMGKKSLIIFFLVTSNLAVMIVQGFYWGSHENNIVYWIVRHFADK